jgi:transmembrane sensor
MKRDSTVQMRIAEEAVDWLLRLHDPRHSAADREAFSSWLKSSPMHIEQYLAAAATWEVVGDAAYAEYTTAALIDAARDVSDRAMVVDISTIVSKQQTPLRDADRRWRPKRMVWLSLAASVLLCASAWLIDSKLSRATLLETMIGEQRTATLEDGSVVFLNTNSRIRVAYRTDERHIELTRGEARFQVAKNPRRPFVVATTESNVRAIGTIFNVRLDHGSTQVAVIEGRVQVTKLNERSTLNARPFVDTAGKPSADTPLLQSRDEFAAGERAVVTRDGIARDMGPPLDVVTSWTKQRVVFHDSSLSEVVNEFNRYRRNPLIVDDPQLATLKISGVFDVNDPESLIAYFHAFENVNASQSADGTVHLSRKGRK